MEKLSKRNGAEAKKRRSGHMTGMQGVYLAAAELTKWGLVVSPTSRSVFGADLLVTDEKCKKAWSVQVKTNYGRPKFWLVSRHSKQTASRSHIYVLVNLCRANARQRKVYLAPDFYVVPSRIIAGKLRVTARKTGSIFYSIFVKDVQKYKDRWHVFGSPGNDSY
jgi:hypothetical protein